MKHKSVQYKNDIIKLKKLKATNPEEYKKQLDTVSKKHSISVKTIYRDMNKPDSAIGVRKTRKDAGKFKTTVNEKQEKMVTELVASGKPKQEAKKITEEKTGEKISGRKLKRFKPLLAGETLFGEDVKKLFDELLELNLMAPDSGIKVIFRDTEFLVDKETLNSISLDLTNCYNRQADPNKRMQFDLMQYAKMKQLNDVLYMQSIARASADVKSLEACSRMLQRLEIDYGSLDTDLKLILSCFRVLKPDITDDEGITLIKKLAEKKSDG